MNYNVIRKYWLDTMLQIVTPVFDSLCRDKLRAEMPIESKSTREDREQYTYLEALGRSLVGMAPWLELSGDSESEEPIRLKYAEMARKAIANAVDPSANDFMNFDVGYQPIVDAAFLVHAILRAPTELWKKLDPICQQNLIIALKKTRTRKPYACNWLLFSAIIEAFLYFAGEPNWDPMRIDYAIKQHELWYKGDGVYGDGKDFHFDYYNSLVIQPMLVDIMNTVGEVYPDWSELRNDIQKRASHYATILEHLIAPDGSYPIIGRSSSYRFGAFQNLSQAVLQNQLEPSISNEQVRCGLTAVIRRVMAFDNFDKKGWLRVGVCGSQPDMGENYISTGSLYLCSTVFLPLGLPQAHPFWSNSDKPWTSCRMWSGENMLCEHSV